MTTTPELRSDVLVVGGGPAGLAAACAAAERGAAVRLLDDGPQLGGQIWRAGAGRLHPKARALFERASVAGVEASVGAVVQVLAPDRLVAQGPDGLAVYAASRVVLAVGAQELFLPFPGWTLPGVTGVGALQALSEGGFDVSGRRVVVAGSGPLLLAVAAKLRRRGARVVGLYEQATPAALLRFSLGLWRVPSKLREALRLAFALRGVPRSASAFVLRAEGGEGLEAVTVKTPTGLSRVPCELLACAYGLVPRTRLAWSFGCAVRDGAVRVDEHQQTTIEGVYAAGEATGVGGVELSLCEGAIAGAAAAGHGARELGLLRERRAWRRFAGALAELSRLDPELLQLADPETIVCRCEDVAYRAFARFSDARCAKLATRCGMGSCQGRVCGPALELLFGWPQGRPRPPLEPVSVARLAGLSDTLDAEPSNPSTESL